MKPHDLIVFGATSFVGQILCRYLAENHPSMKWAAAGRSQKKLELLRAALGPQAAQLPLLLADAADEASLRALCEKARVIVSTVGPYALHGQLLVKVCAETGTDYCDLTGEPQWIHRMLRLYEASARTSGARIVHCCGFDSIPSDLGVHFTQAEARRRWGQSCSSLKMRVTLRGALSGGTIASMINVIQEATADPAVRKELSNPYSLCPDEAKSGPRQPNLRGAAFDAETQKWLAPFVMSGINTRVVHRSNALTGFAYGREFLYEEAMTCGRGLKGRVRAVGLSTALNTFTLVGAVAQLRSVVERFLPEPGEGPSAEAQAKGFFEFCFFGTAANGEALRTRVTGDRDPGYGSTAKMLGEAAACLAFDIPKADKPGGFWTPATALGDRLIERLRARAGVTFEIV
jgi:short subunit dehydrogenase-like uncharacterized protein